MDMEASPLVAESNESNINHDDNEFEESANTDGVETVDGVGGGSQEDTESNEVTGFDEVASFREGDHVYQLCPLVGIPGILQRHGIVTKVDPEEIEIVDCASLLMEGRPQEDETANEANESNDKQEPKDGDDKQVDSSTCQPTGLQHQESTEERSGINSKLPHDGIESGRQIEKSSGLEGSPEIDCVVQGQDQTDDSTCHAVKRLRIVHGVSHAKACEEGSKKTYWYKVQYSASRWKRFTRRTGTYTLSSSDEPGMVLARAHFLLSHRSTLPPFSSLQASSECVALWCKTGAWTTIRASDYLHLATAGQVKSATTLALLAASVQVTVPAAGIWGLLGYTSQASLLATQPWAIPALVGFTAVTVGGPAVLLHKAKSFWHQTSVRLNEEFWESAMEQPDAFAHNITEWSTS